MITNKYGIVILISLAHDYEIDAQNGNTFWQNNTRKEITNIDIAFEILENSKHTPGGSSKAIGHLIFDVMQ
eukprot:7100162-Ditylum_brightwellii.AAC.1